MRMERISLSLSSSLSLALSHSAERSLPSAASPANHQNSIPKVYQRNWQLGTQKTEPTTPGKKKSFFCLPEILRTWILTQCASTSKVPDYQTKKSPGRGHQHSPTSPTSRETQRKKNRRQDRASQLPPSLLSTAPTHPLLPISPQPPLYIHSLHPQNTTTKDPQLLFLILIILILLLSRPTSQPRKKQKMQARIEKDGEFVLGSDF